MQTVLSERQAEYVAFRSIQSKATADSVRLVLSWWRSHLGGTPDGEATQRHAQSFLAANAGRWSSATCYRVSTCLRSYYRWRGDNVNPWENVRIKTPKRRIPRVVEPEEWLRLETAMAQIPDNPRRARWALRRWAMVRLMFAAGLRNVEVRRLRVEDVDLDRRFVTVLGKGDKERSIPFGPHTQAVLRLWLEKGRPHFCPHRPPLVFPSERGHQMNASMVGRVMHTALDLAGITRRLYPHLLRHSYATTLLEGGANIREVQELLGHASLQTTEIYTHTRPERLKAAYDRAFGDRA